MTYAQKALAGAVAELERIAEENPDLRRSLKPLRDFTKNLEDIWDVTAKLLVDEVVQMRALIVRGLELEPRLDTPDTRATLGSESVGDLDLALSALERQRDAMAELLIPLQAALEDDARIPAQELAREMLDMSLEFACLRMPTLRMW